MLNCTRRTRSMSSAVNASPAWLPIRPRDRHSRKRCTGSPVRSLSSSSRMAPPVPSCYAVRCASDSEVPLSGLEFLFIDVTASIALAQNFERFVAWGRTFLADEPAHAEDQPSDHNDPEHQHHEHHQKAARTPHEHHRVGAPVPFPRTILRKRGRGSQQHEDGPCKQKIPPHAAIDLIRIPHRFDRLVQRYTHRHIHRPTGPLACEERHPAFHPTLDRTLHP